MRMFRDSSFDALFGMVFFSRTPPFSEFELRFLDE
jgi:hypothetical protein